MIFIDFPQPIGSMYGIYTNIGGILMVNVTIYSSTMDPMGKERPFWVRFSWVSFSNPGDVPNPTSAWQASPVA
jgi:hypothetical protein